MADTNSNDKKLGVIALSAIVVSAMIGGGTFSLPQNMAQDAGVLAITLAWVITGFGMFFIANSFRVLSDARPDATTGIYAYARLGFGRFAGFQMAWQYWLCNAFGNVGYAVMLMDAMDYFFPGWFTGGNNLWSIIGGSLMIWSINFFVLGGVKQASLANTLGTIFKLVPLLLFILILLVVFRWSMFTTDMGGTATIAAEHIKPLGNLLTQIKSTMLVTLWAFIGIEGAIVISGRAKSASAVGKATVLGFLLCLIIYVLMSLLPFGRMHQPQLAVLANPSTAPLLQAVVGDWGGWMMNLGVIVSIMTSWLAFTIMIAQIPYAAAQDGTFPKIFTSINRNGSPNISLWVTSAFMQLVMLLVYFSHNAWIMILSITSVMILPPYLACTAYLWQICARKQYPSGLPVKRPYAYACGVIGTIFALWLIYAAGLNYLMLAFIMAAAGIPVFVHARRRAMKNTPGEHAVFTRVEFYAMILIIATAVITLGTVVFQEYRKEETHLKLLRLEKHPKSRYFLRHHKESKPQSGDSLPMASSEVAGPIDFSG